MNTEILELRKHTSIQLLCLWLFQEALKSIESTQHIANFLEFKQVGHLGSLAAIQAL